MNRFALVAVAALSLAPVAKAQTPPPARGDAETRDTAKERPHVVLIVRSPGDERVVSRVRAELASSGWPSVELTPDPRDPSMSLARLSALVSAAAAVRVLASVGAVEVWVAETPGAAPAAADIISVGGTHPDDRVLALRATEALRARGLRLERRPADEPLREPAPEVLPPKPVAVRTTREAPPPAPPSPPLAPSRGLWLEVAPGAALSPGGLAPALDGWVGIRFDRSTWSAGALLLIPITNRRIAASEGSAQLSMFMTGAYADLALLRGAVQANAGAGLGAAISRMKGSATRTGYQSADDTVVAAAPFARASVRLEMGYGWRLGAGAILGTSVPRVSAQFGDREVASWGRPYFFVGELGIEAPLLTWAEPK